MAQDMPLRVFVMGCARGGTTLTQRLVADRLGLYTLPETRFFASLIGNSEPRMFPTTRRVSQFRSITSNVRERLGLSTGMEYGSTGTLKVPQRRKWSPVRQVTADFIEALDRQARETGVVGWLEKTPFHVHYARTIQGLVPGAWMIHILRDPQETIASLCDVATRYPQSWGITYDRVERAVDNWNAAIADSARMVGQPRQIFLPYAAVASAPGPVMDRVAGLIGFPSDFAGALETTAVGDRLATKPEEWKAAAIDGAVAPAASKWDSALTKDERLRAAALIKPIPAPLLAAMQPFLDLQAVARSSASLESPA